jgi:hypothetical protein
MCGLLADERLIFRRSAGEWQLAQHDLMRIS